MQFVAQQFAKYALAIALLIAFALLPEASQAVPRDANANNGAVLKLQAMVKRLSSERDAAVAENSGLAAEVEQLKREKADALAAKDSLSSELSVQKNTAEAVRNRLGSTESRLQDVSDKYAKTNSAKAELERELAALKAKQQGTEQQLKTCGQHNVKLYQAAEELLERYQNKGTFSGLLQDEPLLQFQSVDMQNIVQEYQDQLSAGRYSQEPPSSAEMH
ncbi:hypothetical protein [Methylomonas methanica]|uniref:DNA repair protein n=1 Tax=Methylomonas methanica (strain DSM 25384 / MC09) TaxID=857087 RepID=G0A771_METMM|nr:hypothetical protein [Methylomonas methanica]AEF99364.1 hypothetical protein Metme_0926 [Methylomonas methanica MC09]